MKIVIYLLVFLSDFFAAAHFLRFNDNFFVAIFVISPFLGFFKKRWADFVVLLSLLASFVILLRTSYIIVEMRIQASSDYHRFFVIMGIVLMVQLLSIFIFVYYRVLRRIYV